MDYFLKINKSIIYPLLILLVISIFGFNFFISLLGHILLLLFLIPLLLLILLLIGFNSYKSNINTYDDYGAISFNVDNTFSNCEADLNNINGKNQIGKKPSESTIEVKAEEVK